MAMHALRQSKATHLLFANRQGGTDCKRGTSFRHPIEPESRKLGKLSCKIKPYYIYGLCFPAYRMVECLTSNGGVSGKRLGKKIISLNETMSALSPLSTTLGELT